MTGIPAALPDHAASYARALSAHRVAVRDRLRAAAATADDDAGRAEAVELARAQMHADIDRAAADLLAALPAPRRPILRTRPYRDTSGEAP